MDTWQIELGFIKNPTMHLNAGASRPDTGVSGRGPRSMPTGVFYICSFSLNAVGLCKYLLHLEDWTRTRAFHSEPPFVIPKNSVSGDQLVNKWKLFKNKDVVRTSVPPPAIGFYLFFISNKSETLTLNQQYVNAIVHSRRKVWINWTTLAHFISLFLEHVRFEKTHPDVIDSVLQRR